MIKILIADDHALMRLGIRRTLEDESDIRIVGEAETSHSVLDLVGKVPADVLLLDISMPGATGLSLLHEVVRVKRKLKILILSMHPEDRFAVRAFKEGACGYVCKETAPETLATAIRKVAAGGRYISNAMAEKLATELQELGQGMMSHELLSEREYEVFLLIAGGKTIGAVADELSLSVPTVSTYRTRILEKMNLKTNSDLVRYAYSHHLVD